MKKLIFLVVAALLIVTLAGCGDGKNGGTDNDTNGNGNGTETAQWAAYAFGDTVKPSSGGSGKISSFTIESSYTEAGKVRQFKIEGTYEGKEMAQITTQKMVTTSTPFNITTSNVTASLECYKVKHRITVVKDDTGASHPASAEITIWIPTGELETTATFFWIYPKATYTDSDNHMGTWSYYLTAAMQNEMQNPPAGQTVAYLPVVEGDFYGYDDWTLFGLYGYGWYWFKGFAEGGQQHMEVGSWSYGGCSFTCSEGNKTIGGYTFSAWTLDATCSGQGYTGGYKGSFSPDLPLPIHLKVASTGGGTSSEYEYTLTDLKLQ
jgi:hypothetical protein